MEIKVKTSQEVNGTQTRYFAEVNTDPKFLVGTEITYPKDGKLKGLFLSQKLGHTYDRAHYRTKYGFWADFIYPSAQCETRAHFRWLNTYDRAFFTFGFLQFAAHEAEGDFVQLFRALLKTPQGKDYFPELFLNTKGFISRTLADGSVVRLENKHDTDLLKQYLNPTRLAIEEKEEVDRAARFIHWCDTHESHRDLQVEVGIRLVKQKMKTYNRWYKLDGVVDKVCAVIMDIHHQGRGKRKVVQKALEGADPDADYTNLLKIGSDKYSKRIKTLSDTIAELTGPKADQPFGKNKYDAKTNDFIPI
jgi:hypothetical protein